VARQREGKEHELLVATLSIATAAHGGWSWTTLNYPGETYIYPAGVSGNTVAGNYNDATGKHVFVYDGITWTTLDCPYPDAEVIDIDGSNLVGYHTDNLVDVVHGYLHSDGTWTTLDYPEAGTVLTYPTGISGERIVGLYTGPGEGSFVYDGTTWTTLSHPAGYRVTANGIDGDRIVGTYTGVEGWERGFLYDGTTWTTLDYPGTAAGSFTPIGVSGNVIVGYYMDDTGEHSCLYDGMTWTALNYPGALDTMVNGVSGNSIVGLYSDASGDHAYLLTIPEPATLSLLAMGSLVLVRRARQR